jgi:hypothetical protein
MTQPPSRRWAPRRARTGRYVVSVVPRARASSRRAPTTKTTRAVLGTSPGRDESDGFPRQKTHHTVNPLAIQHPIAGRHRIPRHFHTNSGATAPPAPAATFPRSSSARFCRTARGRDSSPRSAHEHSACCPHWGPDDGSRTTGSSGRKRTTPLTRWPYRTQLSGGHGVARELDPPGTATTRPPKLSRRR